MSSAGDEPEPDGRDATRSDPGREPPPARNSRGSDQPERTSGESGAGGADAHGAGTEAAVRKPTPLTQQLGRLVILLLAVAFGIFAVANSHPVEFSWVFGETPVRPDATDGQGGGVPLILLLLAAFATGAVIGALSVWQARRGRRARRSR